MAAVAVSSLLLCSAQAGGKQRGRPIEFSEPRSDEVTTNLHQLTSKKDGLKQLEEDLYKPLQSFAPKSSLEGVAAPPARPPAGPVIQSKRAKELLERRKNWVFMSPEDLLAGPTVEEILKSPRYEADGQEKKELPPLERYYQRLAAKRPGGEEPQPIERAMTCSARPESRTRAMNLPRTTTRTCPADSRKAHRRSSNLSESDTSGDPFARSATRSSFSDTFGLGDNTPSKEQVLEHKKFMDEYHSLVDPSWQPPAAANPVNPLARLRRCRRDPRETGSGPGRLCPARPRTRGWRRRWTSLIPCSVRQGCRM